MEPGFHRAMPRADYDAITAVNFSKLKWMDRSPAHARAFELHPPEPTAALAFGQACHVGILEPETWQELYIAGPPGDRRTKEVRDAWRALEKAHPKAEVLTPADHAAVEAMRAAALANPTARKLLEATPRAFEASFLWNDPATGLPCKGRVDLLTLHDGWPTVVDLKSTTDARRFPFAMSAARNFYHVQAAWYLDGLNLCLPASAPDTRRRYLLLAMEKERPHASAVYELPAEALELGRRTYRRWLDEWDRCVAAHDWPGYPQGVAELEFPEWLWKQEPSEGEDVDGFPY